MATKEKPEQSISKEEQIGFHKGSLDTLLKERSELVRIVTIVDQLIKVHAGALQQLGIKLTKSASTGKDGKKLEESL